MLLSACYEHITWQYINKRKNLNTTCPATFINPMPSQVPNWSYYNPGLALPQRRLEGTHYKPTYQCCRDLEFDRELLFGTIYLATSCG